MSTVSCKLKVEGLIGFLKGEVTSRILLQPLRLSSFGAVCIALIHNYDFSNSSDCTGRVASDHDMPSSVVLRMINRVWSIIVILVPPGGCTFQVRTVLVF